MITIMIAILSTYQFYWRYRQKVKKLPPGPSRFINFLFVIKCLLKKGKIDVMTMNREFVKYYGQNGIFYQNGFGLNLCKICCSKVARQVLNNKNALDRPIFGDPKSEIHIENTADGTAPFANLNGKEWESRRKLSQAILFRMCTSKYVNQILDEALTNTVFPKLNQIIDNKDVWYPMDLMKYCAFNTLFYANYGRPTSINDPLYHQMIDVITRTFALFQPGLIYSVLPWYILALIKLNPYSDYHKILELIKERTEVGEKFGIQQKEFKEKQESMTQNKCDDDNDDEPTYYIDYIHNKLTESEVEADIGALFGAGTDTTSTTLNFCIVLSAKYPKIQEKVRNELMECYKNASIINEKDSKDGIKRFNINWIVDHQLVYLRAFIYEVLRVSSVTMLGLPHIASKDVYVTVNDNIDGGKIEYCIPKGTIIAYVIEFMHKNTENKDYTENWVNSSNEMCLENWINEDTKKFEINESFFTFGTGRRDCVGRNLAIKELYIIMAYLFMNYRFTFKNIQDINKPIKTFFNGVNQIDPPIPVKLEKL